MKVLFYASTFGADLLAFALYLENKPNVTIKVLLSDPEQFKEEGVADLYPLQAELIEKRFRNYFFGPKNFEPDITIMDNEVPLRPLSPKGMMLWHGFGWKGPNDKKEFSLLHKSIWAAWGSAMKPNKDFCWQCFGPWDLKHRTKVSGFHPENCEILGAASHDLLRDPLPKEAMQAYYPFDVVNKKTILFAPTWHYGEVFSHWGKDVDLFEKLLQRIEKHDANVILRLHDSYRFDKEYRQFLSDLEDRHPHMFLKYKDKNPDNLLDIMVSDALITNYSSIANLYYATGRPTLHIYPVKDEDEDFMWRRQTAIGTIKKKVESVQYIWKLPPEEHGGLMAKNFETLLEQVDLALNDPDCCKERSQQFLDKYMLGADGKNCERIWNSIKKMVEE